MFELLIKGLIIGLCISVPLGPIGMLCVQRTLNRGRKYGIITGLGATTSDLIYTIITLFFLKFVIGFIEEHRMIIEIAGSIIVIIFGFFTFKSRPSKQPLPSDKSQNSMLTDYASALALTFSNPLILFVLMALFARIDFIEEKSSFGAYFVGISALLLGAFLWWCSLTYLVSNFKNKLSYRGLRNINIITGLVIISIGIVGLLMSILKDQTLLLSIL